MVTKKRVTTKKKIAVDSDQSLVASEPSIIQAKARIIQDISPTGVSELADTKKAAEDLVAKQVDSEETEERGIKDNQEYSPEILSADNGSKKNKPSSGLMTAILIILVLILAAGTAYWYFAKYKNFTLGDFKAAEISRDESDQTVAPGVIDVPMTVAGDKTEETDSPTSKIEQEMSSLEEELAKIKTDSLEVLGPPVSFDFN